MNLMKIRNCLLSLILGGLLAPQFASATVFLRISGIQLPPVRDMGVKNLVFSWPIADASVVRRVQAQGYQVFLEAAPGDLSAVAETAAKMNIAGVILRMESVDGPGDKELFRRLTKTHPGLSFLLLNPDGKEPQMKGRLVVERNGILQVSSPTSQPWVDTNLALMKLARAFHPEVTPLYTFHWDLSDVLRSKLGPAAEDYCLAISEADAFHADVILDLHEKLQQGLVRKESSAWAVWNSVKRYIAFQRSESTVSKLRPVANTAVVTDAVATNYEGLNLMARHNIPFVVLRPGDLEPKLLETFDTLVVFSVPSSAAVKVVGDFAKHGGIVVLVNLRAEFPWHSLEPAHKEKQATTYNVGAGQVIELAEPVIDPEAFSRDLRRLMGLQRTTLGLWNSLTSVAIVDHQDSDDETIVNLVNYALEAEPVQVQIKGHFTSIRYESPDKGCCQYPTPVQRGPFTEFVIPALFIRGEVHLNR
jgi:hypothetical protein